MSNEETTSSNSHVTDPNPSAAAAPTTTSIPQLKIAEVTPFDGDRTKYTTFKRQVVLHFAATPLLFTRPQGDLNKIIFTLSHMKGGLAEEWANVYIDRANSPTGDWGTWPVFVEALEKAFKDANEEQTAQHHLEALRQGKRTAQDFFFEFESTMRRAGYSAVIHETYLISLLERNLSSPLVD